MRNDTKIALVTGATRGIGREVVRQLAQSGVRTILTGRHYERTMAAALEFQAKNLPVEVMKLDVTNEHSISLAEYAVRNRYGRLDVLINNAAVLLDEVGKLPSEQSLSAWRETFETNLFGLISVTQAFLPLLHQSSDGCIVNVSDLDQCSALRGIDEPFGGSFSVPAHSISKSAVNAWTLHLSHELRQTKVRVHSVHPGKVRTQMTGCKGDTDAKDGAAAIVNLALVSRLIQPGGFVCVDEVML